MKATKEYALPSRMVPAFAHEDEVCAEEGCTTVLSRYNPEEYCNQHGGGGGLPLDPTNEGEEEPNGADLRKTCSTCGENLSVDAFRRRSDGYGRYAVCRSCTNANARMRYAEKTGTPVGIGRPRIHPLEET